MNMTVADKAGHELIQLEVDGTASLSTELTQLLDDALGRAQDAGDTVQLIVRVVGHRDPAAPHRWPGPANIQAVSKWERTLRRMERAAPTTLVLAEKNCSGLALDLLLVADRRVARSDLRIQMAAPGAGVWPGMALYRLAHQIGYARSRKLLMSGHELDAELALKLDIIDEILGETNIGASDAHFPASVPSDDLALRRRLLQDSLSCSFDEALGVHLAACDRTLRRQQSGDA